jgi:hypothetical protein
MKKPKNGDACIPFEGGQNPDSIDRFIYVFLKRMYDRADIEFEAPECAGEQDLLNRFTVDGHRILGRVQHEIVVDADETNAIQSDFLSISKCREPEVYPQSFCRGHGQGVHNLIGLVFGRLTRRDCQPHH